MENESYINPIRIIAVMFGRLRLNVDQAIRNFERIWLTMAATMSRYDRIMPFRKAKISNSLSLDRAFDDLLTERRERLNESFQFHISNFDFAIGKGAVSDEFESDSELCKTCVLSLYAFQLTNSSHSIQDRASYARCF